MNHSKKKKIIPNRVWNGKIIHNECRKIFQKLDGNSKQVSEEFSKTESKLEFYGQPPKQIRNEFVLGKLKP